MKIVQLGIENFKCFENIKISFDKPINLIFDLLDIKVDRSNIKKRLQTWLNQHSEVISSYGIDPNADPFTCFNKVPSSLEEGYEEAYEERKLVKRELKAISIPEDLPQNMTIQELQKRLEEKNVELFALHTQIGATKGIALGERKQLEREISEISNDILRLQMEVKDFDFHREKTELAQMEQERESLGKEFQSLHENLWGLQLNLRDLEATAKEEEKHLSKFKSFEGSCPFFEGLLKENVACQTEKVLEAIESNKKLPQTSELSEEIKVTREKIEASEKRIDKQHASLASLDGGISSRRNTIARLEANPEKIAELQKKKENTERVLKSLDDSKIDQTEELKAKVKELEAQIEKDKSLLSHLQLAEKKRSLENELNKLEVLTLAFSPKGIMADLLSKAITDLITNANQLMKEITGGRYSIHISAEDGFRIFLCDHTRNNKTDIKLASSSEQFRVEIVIQAVLAQLSGLKFLVIDGVDILDQKNKGFFFNFLKAIITNFNQIIALCTIGQYHPKNPEMSDIDFWVIEDGKVHLVR